MTEDRESDILSARRVGGPCRRRRTPIGIDARGNHHGPLAERRRQAKGPGRRRKPPRQDVQPPDSLCAYCAAKCCRYFALPLDTPTTWEDFEYLRWYLFHQRAAVFLEDGNWYLLVNTECKHLRDDGLCAIYEDRPQVCRDYHTDQCEYEDDWVYERYFETSEQIEEYAEAVLKPRNGCGIRTPKPGPRENARRR